MLAIVTDCARKCGERHGSERNGERLMDGNAEPDDEQRDDDAAAARPNESDDPPHKEHRQK